MKLTVWGARGSIPVSGPEYDRYGGDTTCVCLETNAGETVILDAGTGLRPLGNVLLKEGKKTFHFVLSHAHWDHLLGFPFFKPLYRDGVTIHIHGCTYAQQSIRTFLSEVMQPPFFPVTLDDVHAELLFDNECRPEFSVASMCCESIPLSHPNNGYGFRFTEGEKSFAFFPDNELTYAHSGGKTFGEYVSFVRGVDVLLHDAEYLPEEYEDFSRGWGHSVFSDTVKLAVDAEVKRLLMWHLNQDRVDDDVDMLIELAEHAASEAGRDDLCMMARTGLVLDV
jgi:phosphoribosyl 1,2-cyclic phosphodiesterase